MTPHSKLRATISTLINPTDIDNAIKQYLKERQILFVAVNPSQVYQIARDLKIDMDEKLFKQVYTEVSGIISIGGAALTRELIASTITKYSFLTAQKFCSVEVPRGLFSIGMLNALGSPAFKDKENGTQHIYAVDMDFKSENEELETLLDTIEEAGYKYFHISQVQQTDPSILNFKA